MSVEEHGDPIGQTLGSKFLVKRVVGAGGMGVVYEVEHVITKKLGALKLLHRSLASRPRVVERFIREASAAARIGNPHIVETYDAGELPSGEPYMFMELLSGSAVRELIQARGRLGFAEACEIVLQAADGLTAAHAAGIVHRDIKPENLFVSSGPPAYLKILDFGISKFSVASDHRLTAEGAPMGTPYYMSPEQVAGRSEVDARSDVYALGVLLYECVIGRVPFDAPTLPALSIKIFEGNYTPPSDVLVDIPAGFDAVIARAMAVEPSARYDSMRDFREALARLGSGTPVSLGATLESAAPSLVVPVTPPEGEAQANPVVPVSGSRRLALAAGVGLAAVAGVVVALNVGGGASPTATPDDASVPEQNLAKSPILPPTQAPPLLVPAPLESHPEAPVSAVVSRAVPPRALVSKPAPSASARSRAAHDGLSEENPFRE